MTSTSPIRLKDHKEKQIFLSEVIFLELHLLVIIQFLQVSFHWHHHFTWLLKLLCFQVGNSEKQLWALIYSKGLLHSDVQDLYRKVRSSYEEIILSDREEVEFQDVEYSLWKLHYKHIDEFRKTMKKSSGNGESIKLVTTQNVGNVQRSDNKGIAGFTSFLSEATEFYQNLVVKIGKCYRLPEDTLFNKKSGSFTSVEPKKMQKCQFLCHRFLVCLGDLARYKEQYEKPDDQNHNWSVAASHYLEATMIWPDSGNPQNQVFFFSHQSLL